MNIHSNLLLIILVQSLAVWRLSSLLAREDGPFNIFARVRSFIFWSASSRSGPIGKLATTVSEGIVCIWCNSIWFSVIISFLPGLYWQEWVVAVFSTSALTILIETGYSLIKQVITHISDEDIKIGRAHV